MVEIEIKDGKILKADPETIIGHVSVPFPQWMAKMAYS